MTTPQNKPPVNPKTAAIMGLVAAAFVVVVAFFPKFEPICVAAGFCDEPAPVVTPSAE